jgi:steroid delta-isomerase-like uncharacterized protein
MSDANKKLVRGFLERINAGDLGAVDELVSDDFVEHEEISGLVPGKAGVKQMFEMFHSAFSNTKFEADEVLGDGDRLFVRSRITGTHRGEFMGIPATGRTINVGIFDNFRVADGQLAEHWGVLDTGALMQQLTGG